MRNLTNYYGDYFEYWRWYNACLGIGYFFLGNYYKKVEKFIEKIESKNSVLIMIMYFVISVVSSIYLNTHIDFASATFDNAPICLILSLIALWALICLCKKIGKNFIIGQLGRDTLFLFAINIWCIKILKLIFSYCKITSIPDYFYGLIISIIAIYIASILNKFIRNSFPWIIGESK